MRLGECFQFSREEEKKDKKTDKVGVRCISMGTKTDSSERTIPLPSGLCAELPRITRPLFGLEPYEGDREKAAKAASKRLNRFLHVTCGIKPDDPVKEKKRRAFVPAPRDIDLGKHSGREQVRAAHHRPLRKWCPCRLRSQVMGRFARLAGQNRYVTFYRDDSTGGH